MKIQRLLSITFILLSRGRVSCEELADKFGVSPRTIYRDINDISAAGIPVFGSPGKSGGFSIMDNYKIDRRLLSPDELASVLTTLKGLSSTFSSEQLERAIDKISTLASRDQEKLIAGILDRVVFDVLPMGASEKQRTALGAVYTALNSNRVLAFTYSNGKMETTRRETEPLRLISKNRTWYLFAYCRLKSDFRNFKISRMDDLRILSETFIPREVDYRDYEFSRETNRNVDLVLRFIPEIRALIEDFFPPDSISVEDDGSVTVRTSMSDDEWMYAYLLSYGPALEVQSPERVRKEIIGRAKKILEVYKI